IRAAKKAHSKMLRMRLFMRASSAKAGCSQKLLSVVSQAIFPDGHEKTWPRSHLRSRAARGSAAAEDGCCKTRGNGCGLHRQEPCTVLGTDTAACRGRVEAPPFAKTPYWRLH